MTLSRNVEGVGRSFAGGGYSDANSPRSFKRISNLSKVLTTYMHSEKVVCALVCAGLLNSSKG